MIIPSLVSSILSPPILLFDETEYIIDYIVLEMIYGSNVQALKEYGRVS